MNFGLTVIELTNLELTAGLKRGIDNNFQRVVGNARREWEARFEDKEPSDACVRVDIAATDPARRTQSTPGSGFVPSPKKSPSGSPGEGALGFAH